MTDCQSYYFLEYYLDHIWSPDVSQKVVLLFLLVASAGLLMPPTYQQVCAWPFMQGVYAFAWQCVSSHRLWLHCQRRLVFLDFDCVHLLTDLLARDDISGRASSITPVQLPEVAKLRPALARPQGYSRAVW